MNKKLIYILLFILCILFLVLSLIFNSRSNNAIENSIKSRQQFSSTENNKDAYIYIDYISEGKDNYYIVFDKENPYVIYLSDELFNKIKDYDLENRNIKIVGDSYIIDDKIKEKILTIYNKGTVIGDEEYLSESYFEDIFGKYYLKVLKIEDNHELYKTPSFLSSLFLDISLVSLLILGFKIILDRSK